MKTKITQLSAAMLLFTVFQTVAQNSFYPGITTVDRNYFARKVATPPTIDGEGNDIAWADAPWKQASVVTGLDAASWPAGSSPVAPEGAFEGATDIDVQFKIVWDDNHYYMLIRYKDDKIIYADNHNGYQAGSIPSYVTVTNANPAMGAGDGNSYQAFRMDQIAYWLTPHSPDLEAGTLAYNRANNGVLHNFFPGQITLTTQPAESVLWAAKHNPVSTTAGSPQPHVGTAKGALSATDGYIYIEFKDETWTKLFDTVRIKSSTSGQDWYTGTTPVQGAKFLLQGEVNDADGTTNRRDYINYFTHFDTTNPSTNLKEALVVVLADENGLSVNTHSESNSLKFFVDAAGILRFDESLDIEIYNIQGQLVIKTLNTTAVNLTELPRGIYVVKDKEGKTAKIIKKL